MAVHFGSIGRSVILAAAMAVAGCAKVPTIPSPFVGCDKVPPGVFDSVDWNAVRQVRVAIRHGEFQPSLIRLYQDRAYVMRIDNRDRGARRFQSKDFFAALYIHSVVTEGKERSAITCPTGVWVEPGEVAVVRFIAARDGRYEFVASQIPLFLNVIPDGIVHIEQAPSIAALLPPAIPGITKPDADIPTGPYAPAGLPVAPPPPETPAMPADPALLPLPLPAPEIPGMPADPATLLLPLPAPETPTQPVAPAASADEPPSAAPMIPSEEEKGPADQLEPLDPAETLQPPRSLLPEHAPGNVPAGKANGGAPFGQ